VLDMASATARTTPMVDRHIRCIHQAATVLTATNGCPGPRPRRTQNLSACQAPPGATRPRGPDNCRKEEHHCRRPKGGQEAYMISTTPRRLVGRPFGPEPLFVTDCVRFDASRLLCRPQPNPRAAADLVRGRPDRLSTVLTLRWTEDRGEQCRTVMLPVTETRQRLGTRRWWVCPSCGRRVVSCSPSTARPRSPAASVWGPDMLAATPHANGAGSSLS
jgi:hypothetical protein